MTDIKSSSSINLTIKQVWIEKSSDSALEEFKSLFLSTLNSLHIGRHIQSRWSITKISEGNEAHLIYDEEYLATLKIDNGLLRIQSDNDKLPRYDDIMYSIRYTSEKLSFIIYSNNHGMARLPRNSSLSLDHTYFYRDKSVMDFFAKSNFIPRYAPEGLKQIDGDRQLIVLYSPYYAEHKKDGAMYIINNSMLSFVLKKDDQRTNKEFAYKVADSMDDFAIKYDLGLVPNNFYQYYGLSTKIINDTYFDVRHIHRKIFIDPYVFDFEAEHDSNYYQNIENGMHLMDKVRKNENLEQAIRRVLSEELKISDDFVGAKIWGIEFDRDRDDILTPRLKMNIFVHGVHKKYRSQKHDWV